MLRIQAPEIKLRPHRLEEKAVETRSPARSQVWGWCLKDSSSLPSSFLSLPVQSLNPEGFLREGWAGGSWRFREGSPSVASFPSQCDWGVRTRKTGESHLSWLRSSSANPNISKTSAPSCEKRVRPKAIPSPHSQCWERKPSSIYQNICIIYKNWILACHCY